MNNRADYMITLKPISSMGKCFADESIHQKIAFTMALQDTRALALAEALTSRDKVLEIIESAGEITFSDYPHEKGWIEKVRTKINKLIEENSAE